MVCIECNIVCNAEIVVSDNHAWNIFHAFTRTTNSHSLCGARYSFGGRGRGTCEGSNTYGIVLVRFQNTFTATHIGHSWRSAFRVVDVYTIAVDVKLCMHVHMLAGK